MQACALLLAPITITSRSTVIDAAVINETSHPIEQDDANTTVSEKNHDEGAHNDNPSVPQLELGTVDVKAAATTVVVSESPGDLRSECPALERLRILYDECRQALTTLEREGAILSRQQQQQQVLLPQRNLPHLPLSSARASGTTSVSLSSTPGMMGRSKIVATNHLGTHINRNHSNSAIRTGSMKRPLANGTGGPIMLSNTTTSTTTTTATLQPPPTLPNRKGQYGTIPNSLRRTRLERERSDSSMSTSTVTSSHGNTTTTTTKKSRSATTNAHIGDSTLSLKQQPPPTMDETTTITTSSPLQQPPNNVRQFLAMLNQSDSTNTTISTTSTDTTPILPSSQQPQEDSLNTIDPIVQPSSADSTTATTTTTKLSIKRSSPLSSPTVSKAKRSKRIANSVATVGNENDDEDQTSTTAVTTRTNGTITSHQRLSTISQATRVQPTRSSRRP
jgi:hypothetical protein